ncbi:MAG: hypothetical protein J4F41_01475 [Alphaproteobacteria bacterium]|nr:hypothetical protein [Alphaproteobacteria bacterium]
MPTSFLDQAQSADLFEGIASDGAPWLGLLDADSAIFRLTGDGAGYSASLAKLPPPDPARRVLTTYSRLNYYPAASNSINDPGRYILLGRLTQAYPPEPAGPTSFHIPMSGFWTCVDCLPSGELRQGQLAGQLDVQLTTSSAELDVAGDGLRLHGALGLTKTNELIGSAEPVLTLDGETLSLVRSSLRGGVFGPDAEGAGVMFGVVDTEGRVISGATLGERP